MMTAVRSLWILTILACLPATGSASPDDATSSSNPDVRSEIARLIENAKDAYGRWRIVDLDTGIARMDTAIDLATQHFGPEDTTIATCLVWQSMLYGWKMNVPKCEELINRALELYESQLGPDHPALAAALWVKHGLYSYTRRQAEGRPMLVRAWELLDAYPDFDPDLRAHLLMDYAWNHLNRGEYLQAVEVRKKALELFKQVHGPNHWTVAHALQGIGFCFLLIEYWGIEEYGFDSALTYHERAMELFDRTLGKDMPRTVITREHMARIEWEQGDHSTREAALLHALDVIEATMGPNHLFVADILHQLAWVKLAFGELDQAILYSQRAAEMGRQSNLRNWDLWARLVARVLKEQRNVGESLKWYQEVLAARRKFLSGAFAYASEKSKMTYLRGDPVIQHSIIELAVESGSQEAIEVALQMVLASKAIVIDALAAERKVAYCSDNTHLTRKLKDHAKVCGEIAELVITGGMGLPASALQDTTATLGTVKESLELEISASCAEFADAFAPDELRVDTVARALPEHCVLWEFCKYWPPVIRDEEYAYDPPRYITFALQNDGRATLTDLGEARSIDSLIESLHALMRSAPEDIALHGEATAEAKLGMITDQLYDRIVRPLKSTVDPESHIFVSADGLLHLLPMQILTSYGHYLAEEYEISYLSSGRDLLGYEQPVKPPDNRAVVCAAPDYDSPPATRPTGVFAALDLGDSELRTRGPSDRTECLAVPFDPLPATRTEGEMVARLLQEKSDMAVEWHSSSEASEHLVKGIQISPRVVHLATHGYFCQGAAYSDIGSLTENPLLYSGLAMAGANRTILGEWDSESETEDGILTALEASGLNLVGTELVVLSACQSGVGRVVNAEGVYGLRRAFQHAGARSIVMSLYDVPDQSTATLMERFYTNWLSGKSKAEALRQASLSLLKERRDQKGAAHPMYWAGFILIGNPR